MTCYYSLMKTCSQDQCGRKHYAKGFCGRHYQRHLAGKPMEPAPLINKGQDCSIEDCVSEAAYTGLCQKHYRRHQRYGDTSTVRDTAGANNGRWKDAPGYNAAHLRMGKASDHRCVTCGDPAEEWSYDYADTDELTCPRRGLRYSLKREHYSTRCKPCHRLYDAQVRGGRVWAECCR